MQKIKKLKKLKKKNVEVPVLPVCVRCPLFYADVKLADIPPSGHLLPPNVVMGQL